MTDQDIRWQQRQLNYTRAFAQLTRAVELAQSRPLSELEKQGLIQAFEFVFELAWNLMKDYFSTKEILPLLVLAMPCARHLSKG